MSAIVILSSSPPRDFARSPTPASSLPSPGTLHRDDSPGRKRFKSASKSRVGFPAGFSSARQVLAEKDGAENQTISLGRNRFRSSPGERAEKRNLKDNSTPQKFIEKDDLPSMATEDAIGFTEPDAARVVKINASDVRRGKKLRQTGPLLLQRAMTRRLDWTPPKMTAGPASVNEPEIIDPLFSLNWLEDFGYEGEDKQTASFDAGAQPAKRRKLDLVSKIKSASSNSSAQAYEHLVAPKLSAKRSKSPTKNPLTITGLATSKFMEQENPDSEAASPILQYLSATQAQLQDAVPDSGALQSKVQKTTAAVKKMKASKKARPKSRLVSPSSAMRSFEEQEAIFGSASQLARDESPGLLRDTIEATKQSEASFSHLFSSPQAMPSIPSESNTPQVGTLKFRRSRNLWAAADRDEDDALLHVDTIDLTDTPAIRDAFAGKDVMVQPCASKHQVYAARPSLLCGGNAPRPVLHQEVLLDIDDLVTPSKNACMSKSFHTASGVCAPPTAASLPAKTPEEVVKPVEKRKVSSTKARTSKPKKPNYAGLPDRDLQKQISAYGFKAVKKRDKMIELLEKCWEEKHGPGEPGPEDEVSRAGYSDILTDVHGVLARPVPKVKKTPVRRKKADTDGTTPAKKPRARKKKEGTEKDVEGAPKVAKKAPTRKRKTKDSAIPEEVIQDDDGLVQVEAPRQDGPKASDAMLQPAKTSKPPAKRATKSKKVTQVPTPPPTDLASLTPSIPPAPTTSEVAASNEPAETILQQSTHTSQPKPPLANTASTAITQKAASSPTPDPALLSILDQITTAIYQQSSISSTATGPSSKISSDQQKRNYQKNPTWRQKILLYDPIVLEELATWLNTCGFREIGEDREVSAVEVRTWCESRGICCLWKGGWRGNKSSVNNAD